MSMTTQGEMLHCAPGRTDIALAANSGADNPGIAADALGGLVLPLADVRGTFLLGGCWPSRPTRCFSVGGCCLGRRFTLLRPALG
ncbi:hypothetical protein AB0952_39205 [Streptomyces caniferus]|uniref:hypothetical protein n=1 Tax=Streptomyces caniferus TaxID=285557 RepID=UPI0033CEFBB6